MLKDKIQDTSLAEASCTNAGASTDSSVKASIEETVKAAKDNFMRCLQLNKRRAKHVAIQQKDADVSMLLQGEELRDKSEEGIKKFDEVLTELMKARAEYVADKLAFPEDLLGCTPHQKRYVKNRNYFRNQIQKLIFPLWSSHNKSALPPFFTQS